MSYPTTYQPAVRRDVIKALYHEAKVRRLPMTRLINTLLEDALRPTPGWRIAEEEMSQFGEKKVSPPAP